MKIAFKKNLTADYIQENARYHAVQNLASSRQLRNAVKIKVHETKILPVVLYGCEMWSLKLREEHSLSVFENRVLKKSKEDEMGETCSTLGNTYKLLVGSSEGKRILGKPRRIWEDNNNKMDLRKIGLEGVDYSSGSG
jgi:hypothetical protein